MDIINQVEVGMQLYNPLIGHVVVDEIDYIEGIIYVIEPKSKMYYKFNSYGYYVPARDNMNSLLPDIATNRKDWDKANLMFISAGEILTSIITREIIAVEYCSDFIYTLCSLGYDGILSIGREIKAYHYRRATDSEIMKLLNRLEKAGYELVNDKLIQHEHNKSS